MSAGRAQHDANLLSKNIADVFLLAEKTFRQAKATLLTVEWHETLDIAQKWPACIKRSRQWLTSSSVKRLPNFPCMTKASKVSFPRFLSHKKSNPSEALLLKDEAYQKKIALSIANGINEYLMLFQEEK